MIHALCPMPHAKEGPRGGKWGRGTEILFQLTKGQGDGESGEKSKFPTSLPAGRFPKLHFLPACGLHKTQFNTGKNLEIRKSIMLCAPCPEPFALSSVPQAPSSMLHALSPVP